jgi:hypothetical protein
MTKTVLCLSFILNFCLNSQAQIAFSDFKTLSGNWKGTLTYLDYGDNKTLVTLSMTRQFTQFVDSIIWKSRYDEGKGRFVESTGSLKILDKNSLEYDEHILKLVSKQTDKTTNRASIITESISMDNGKTVSLREIFTFQDDTINIERQVKPEGKSDFFIRHTYRLVREWAAEASGTWSIDLRPSPQAPPYLKDFIIKDYQDGTFSGEFYGTPFTGGKAHTAWGVIHFALATRDANSTYFHSGKIENGKIQGISYSPERDFVMPWFGAKK